MSPVGARAVKVNNHGPRPWPGRPAQSRSPGAALVCRKKTTRSPAGGRGITSGNAEGFAGKCLKQKQVMLLFSVVTSYFYIL